VTTPKDEADALWASLTDAQKSTVASESFALWARNMVVLPDARQGRLQLEARPWYWELYLLWEKAWHEAVVQKCTQIGVSTWVVLGTAHGASYHWPKGFIYYLPQDKQTRDFVKQKVNKVFEATPFLRRTVAQAGDSLGVKSFRKSMGYYRGIETPQNRKSITADVVVLDEYDDMEPEHVKEVHDRSRASDIRRTVKLGVPSVEDVGINAAFLKSTQNYWTLPCEGCGREWTVEDTWPNCVDRETGELKCSKCGEPTEATEGYWKPRNPDSGIPGYTFNGAMNPTVDLLKELEEYENAQYRHLWVRGFLGQPSTPESGKRMTAEQIKAQCCAPEHGGGYDQALSSETKTFMGVDTGASAATRRAYIGEIKDGVRRLLKLWPYEDLADLVRNYELFHVEQGVIDAGGEPTLAKEFCDAFPRRIFRCRFKTGELRAKFNEKTGVVEIDRVAALDLSRDALYSGTVLPSADDEDVKAFASENAALVRTEVRTPEGSVVIKYKSHGVDHGGLTWTYLLMAMSRERVDASAKALGGQSANAKLQNILRRRGLG
jgi:hypothetical protein